MATTIAKNQGKLAARTESGCCSECGWASFGYPGYATNGTRGYKCKNPECGAIKPESPIRIMDRAELPGVLCATVPAEQRYTIDQSTSDASPPPEDPFSFAEFVDANVDLDTKDLAAVAALEVEQTYVGGGGAAAQWKIRRVR